jgi:hyperosmotically inducible periplasmic protein
MSRSAVCMAIGFVGLSAAASAQEEPRAVQEIRRELARLPQYSVFDLVTFDYEKGMVTLGGYVTDPSLKRAAEKAVQRIEGVERATNRIEVLPNSISDDDLRSELYRAIYRDSPLSRYGDVDGTVGPKAIHIVVNRGNVILAGVVDSTQDKHLAELKARGVFGVRRVVNDLEVAGRAD